jgi:hypothetical protein
MCCFASHFAPGPVARTAAILAASLAVGTLLSFTPRVAAADQASPQGRLSRSMTPQILQEYRSRALPAPTLPMERTHEPGGLMTPPSNPQVGDSWNWYIWHFAGGPPHYLVAPCTVRGVGVNNYVVVEDSQWGTRVDQADVDAIVAAWDSHSYGQWPDQGFYQINTETFGPAPDMMDNDPKIYTLLYDFDVSTVDGFFWVYDEYYDGMDPNYRSNECEVIYVDASTMDPGGPGGAYLTSVMSHEFQHMITWYADEDEEIWIEEGMSELAMWLYGTPDVVSGFPSSPDNRLTSWPATPNYTDYIKVYLWSLYFFEHFGGRPMVHDLVSQPANGIAGVQAALLALGYTTTFEELVRNWVTANYLDDPVLDGGLYNYAGEDLPVFTSVAKSTYPVPLTTATVNRWAADYVKFTNGQPLRVTFDGADNTAFYVRLIKYLGGVPLSVEDMTLTAPAQTGSFDLPAFGTSYDQVVMVVTCVTNGTTPVSYGYATTDVPTAVEDPGALSAGLRLVGAGPNPFHGETALRLSLDRSGPVSATVHDAVGALVCLLDVGPAAGGERLIRWDGRDEAGVAVPSGAYFVRVATADGQTLSHRLTVIR